MGEDGSFVYRSSPGFAGTDRFSYTASNGRSRTATASVWLEVAPANASPVAADDGYVAAANARFVVAADRGVLANDVDPEGYVLTVVDVPISPSRGAVEVAPDGSLVYDPAPDFVGADFVYVAYDDTNAANTATARIRVRADPRPTDDAYVTPAGADLLVPRPGLLANLTTMYG